jgi:hypothetical protein
LEALIDSFLPGLFGMTYKLLTEALHLEDFEMTIEKIEQQPEELFTMQGGNDQDIILIRNQHL